MVESNNIMLSPLYRKIMKFINKHRLIIFPTLGKVPHPGIGKTRQYWNMPMDTDLLRKMLEDPTINSYAVLCGQISKNLFVLDFDKVRRYREFTKAFPELAQNTLTVKTRRGYHVYLRAMTTMPRTQHLGHMELLGEGSYVIGPQSLVDRTTYKIIINANIQVINDTDVQKIISELKQSSITTSSNKQEVNDLAEHIPTNDPNALREYQVRMYLKYGQSSKSRNVGLYRAASISMSRGIPYEKTIATLLPVHTQAKPYSNHRRESQKQRSAEGIRTITSAYRYQIYSTRALLQAPKTSTAMTGLVPTALREALLQAWGKINKQGIIVNGSTIPGRLIEALFMEGIEPGTVMTYESICQIGKKVSLSSKSIFEALRGRLSQYNGKHLFQKLTNYSYSQKTPTHVGDYDNRTINKTKDHFSKRCKTRNYFVMPNIEHLCSIFGVLAQSWDAIPYEALKTPKAYRMALHEQYIRRVTPETSATYNGNRLGCHARTAYRYDKELSVKTIPIYGYEPLSWQNVDNEDFYGQPRSNDVTPGKWLQCLDGKRYPAIKGIALKLLSRGDVAVACKRLASRRILGDVSLVLGDVIWRRLDKEKSQSDTYSSDDVLPPFVLPERSSRASTSSNNPSKYTVRRNHDVEAQNDTHINLLTLVKGIGQRRAYQLNDLDIISLDDLSAADPSHILGNLYHGGYLTISAIQEWQYEAKVLLGLEQRRQSDINAERNKNRINSYLTTVRKIIKFIKKSFDLLDKTFGYADLPIPEVKLIEELTIVSTQLKFREGRWYVSLINGSGVHKLNDIFIEFFSLYQTTITRMDNLADYQLDEYGFGNNQFWKSQSRWLAHYRQLIIDATTEYENGDKK
ncbi:MAG: bifunctional DNA primase/polymerase [Chloroflexota bacterium]